MCTCYTKTSLFLRKPAKPDFLKKRSLLTHTALKLFFKIPNSFLMRYISKDKKENFSLDFSQGRINLSRTKYQTRSRELIILVRLCVNSSHQNPDGEEIGVPHIHLYKEGYNDKWAYPLPEGVFSNLENNWETLFDFMKFCNITNTPNFKKGLFS